MIDENFGDHSVGGGCEHRVGALVVGEGDQPNRQGPAAPSRPGRIINRQRCAEDLSGVQREQTPRHDQVAGWITHAQPLEVDDGTDPAPLDQQIPWKQVSVSPDGWAVPLRCLERSLPRRSDGVGIDSAGKFGDGGTRRSISRGERHAA